MVHGLEQRSVFEELASVDGMINPCYVHAHDAAGAEVQMADFAVAHLTVRQADEMFTGANEGVGIFPQQAVVVGLASKSNCVTVSFGAVTPAVEDCENDRPVLARRAGHQDAPQLMLARPRNSAVCPSSSSIRSS